MGFIHGFHRRNLKGDLLGGLTAAVVALPLALAFGNAALGPGGAIYGLTPLRSDIIYARSRMLLYRNSCIPPM